MKQQEIKKGLWALADETRDELLSLCSELIRRPNVNPPIKAREITEYIERYLKRWGIAYRKLEPYKGKPILVAAVGPSWDFECLKEDGAVPEAAETAKTAQISENSAVLCINGHTDTVPPGDLSKWDFDPYCGTVTGTQVLGRGSSDMLCGVAIGLHMARMIAQGRVCIKGGLVLHLVSDEESGGDYGTRWLVEHGYARGIHGVMLPEPTTWNNFETGQKGGITYKVRCTGSQAHMSVCSFHHDHAVLKLLSLLKSLEQMRTITAVYSPAQEPVVAYSKEVARQLLKNPDVGDAIDHVTYNVRSVKSGDAQYSPYELCEAVISFGIPAGVSNAAVKDAFDRLIRQTGYDGFSYEIIRDKEPSLTCASEPLIARGLEIANELWRHKQGHVGAVYQWAGSDAKYYRYAKIPAFQYGPANIDGVHGYNECADIEEILNVEKTYWGILSELSGARVNEK